MREKGIKMPQNQGKSIREIFFKLREFTWCNFHVYSVESAVYSTPQGKIFACGSIIKKTLRKKGVSLKTCEVKIREKGCLIREKSGISQGIYLFKFGGHPVW